MRVFGDNVSKIRQEKGFKLYQVFLKNIKPNIHKDFQVFTHNFLYQNITKIFNYIKFSR